MARAMLPVPMMVTFTLSLCPVPNDLRGRDTDAVEQDDLATEFRRGMEAYSRGDYDAALAGFDPHIEWTVHASVVPDAATYHGHEGVRRFWESWEEAISGMALEVEECRLVAKDRVLAVTRAHGKGAGSGAPVESGRFAQIADFQDGLVVRVRLYGDVGRALEELRRG
jgi:ketosteroid isomerase-like protein